MSNQKSNLSVEESNTIVQTYLQQYHPAVIEEMNKVVVIANWLKQLTPSSTTISPKLLEVPQMLVKDDEIDTYPVNSILKPAIEGHINAITSYLNKGPEEHELQEFLINQSKFLAEQVIYEYQQQILNK